MKQLIINTVLLLISSLSFSQTFTVDNINYEVTSTNPNEVEVTRSETVSGDLVIPDTVEDSGVSYSVVSIADNAFRDIQLTSVVIPNSITLIDAGAFRNSNPITVTLGSNVSFIGQLAFADNTSTENIISLAVVPPTLDSNAIGNRVNIALTVPTGSEFDYLTNGWNGFNTVNGQDPADFLTFVENNITYLVTSLQSNTVEAISTTISGALTIPSTVSFNNVVYTVTSIGNNAFENSQLTSVTISNSVTSIGNGAFRDNPDLATVISNNTTPPTLGDNVFLNTSGAKALTVPVGTEAAYLAAGWTGFFSVNGVVTLGTNFTIDNINYEVTSINPNEVEVTRSTTVSGDLVIPDSVEVSSVSYSVVSIANNAFRNIQLTSVVISNSVRDIGLGAFRNSNLSTISIGSSVVSIGDLAFFDNSNIESIISLAVVPPTLDSNAILNIVNIDLTVPAGSELDYLTNGWNGFNTVNGQDPTDFLTFVENNITYLVTSVEPNTVEAISTTISGPLTIPATVSSNDVVYTVTSIGNNAFENSQLTSVTISNSVTSIGNGAFRDNQLTSVTIPNSVSNIGGNAFRNNLLTNLLIPNNLDAINGSVFRDNQLTSVTIPNSVTIIRIAAFSGNQLTSISIPDSVTAIGDGAFNDNMLVSINAEGAVPATIQTVTFGNRSTIDVTVPQGTEADYISGGWQGFATINGNSIDVEIGATFEQDSITYEVVTGSVASVKAISNTITNGVANIPEVVSFNTLDFNVTEIGVLAFRASELTSVTIPNSVTTIESFAFEENQLTSVSIPNSVTTIGEAAFKDNQLSEVTISNAITEISEEAFMGNELTNVIIPEGVVTIGVRAFRENQLTNVIIPNGVITIDNSAFQGNQLSSLNIPNTVTTIGDGAFQINQLTSIVIPESVTSLASNVFRSNLLTSVTLPDNLTAIPPGTFRDNQLTSVTIPESVTSIGGGSFFDNLLSSIIIPTNVNSIGGDSFRNNQLSSVTIPDNVTTIGRAAFLDNQLSSVTISNSITTIGRGTFGGNQLSSVIIPDGVTLIERNAFQNNQLSSVIIPDNVTIIERDAFRNNFIAEISLPASVETIGSGVFGDNTTLRNVTALGNAPAQIVTGGIDIDSFRDRSVISLTVPEGREVAYRNAGWTGFFSVNGDTTDTDPFVVDGITYEITAVGSPNTVSAIGNTNAGEVTILELVENNGVNFTVTAIGVNAFRNDNITSIIIPNTVTLIDNNAFMENQLTNVSIPEGVTSIGDAAFQVNDLVSIAIPGSVTTIGTGAFRGNQLTSVTFSEGIETMGPRAFMENQITSISLPEGLVTIGQDAFLQNQLTSVTLPNTLEIIEVGAFKDNIIESITIPGSVTTVGRDAFFNNSIITLILEEGLERLDPGAFRNNQLTEVTIPASVTVLERGVFRDNPQLVAVIAAGEIPASVITVSSFDDTFGNRGNMALFVPINSSQAYLDAGWTGFNSITEITLDITVAPKVFLQGASLNPIAGEEDLMRDSLRENGLLPTTSPYGDGATVDPVVFTTTGPDAIVDWVVVELRSGADNENTTVVTSQAALLQRDGDIVGLNGTSTISFTEDAGDYFIAIRHRNHIGVLAAVPAVLSSTASSLDFTQDAAFAKGENLALTEVNGTFAMIAGDADGSSQILNTDITEALTLAGGGEAYSTADADMNGFVLNSDIQLLVLSNSGTVQQFD